MKARLRLISASLLSLLGVIGIALAHEQGAPPAGPACSIEGTEAPQPLSKEDSRVYYIGCGGLY